MASSSSAAAEAGPPRTEYNPPLKMKVSQQEYLRRIQKIQEVLGQEAMSPEDRYYLVFVIFERHEWRDLGYIEDEKEKEELSQLYADEVKMETIAAARAKAMAKKKAKQQEDERNAKISESMQ
jgi:hypothetical protein